MIRCLPCPVALRLPYLFRTRIVVYWGVLVGRHSAPRALTTRAQTVLLAAAGAGVRATADQLSLRRATVKRRRWSSSPAAHSVLERLVE
jgi:DNA-binding NarL/FixJ family response regulator